MISIQELALTISAGTRSRSFTPEALAEKLGLRITRAALLAALLGNDSQESGEGVGGGVSPDGPNVAYVGTEVPQRTYVGTQEYILSEDVRTNVARPAISENISEDVHALAKKLADELGDPASLGWYRQVAEAVSPVLVLDALFRATNIPAHQLRRSRAAFFTAIVAPFVRQARLEKKSAPI